MTEADTKPEPLTGTTKNNVHLPPAKPQKVLMMAYLLIHLVPSYFYFKTREGKCSIKIMESLMWSSQVGVVIKLNPLGSLRQVETFFCERRNSCAKPQRQ